jgi:hypothetical protein
MYLWVVEELSPGFLLTSVISTSSTFFEEDLRDVDDEDDSDRLLGGGTWARADI